MMIILKIIIAICLFSGIFFFFWYLQRTKIIEKGLATVRGSIEETAARRQIEAHANLLIRDQKNKGRLEKIDKKQNIKILKSSLKITKHTDNGFVQEIMAQDNKWTGEEWKKIFGLNSTNFYLENYNGKLRMVTVGKGHDMGMSLYGANVLAKKQLSAATILSYYYPGTKILD